jgi:hypothetical protein
MLCGVVVCAVGLTAAPANASPSGAPPSSASASAADSSGDSDDQGPAYQDCFRAKRGQFTALKPGSDGRLAVSGTLAPCRKLASSDRLAISAFGPNIHYLAGLTTYGAAPDYGFTIQVTLPVGTTSVCMMRTPFGSDDCFKVSVHRVPYGSAAGTPVVGQRISTDGKKFRARTDPPPIGFCATCW